MLEYISLAISLVSTVIAVIAIKASFAFNSKFEPETDPIMALIGQNKSLAPFKGVIKYYMAHPDEARSIIEKVSAWKGVLGEPGESRVDNWNWI